MRNTETVATYDPEFLTNEAVVVKTPDKSKGQRALNRDARATSILDNGSNQPAGSTQSTSRSERNLRATMFI